MNQSSALIREAEATLREACSLPIRGLTDPELCLLAGQVEQAGRLLDGLRALTAAEIDYRSRPELGHDGLAWRHGHSKGVYFVEHLTRASQAEAARRIRLGADLRPGSGFLGESTAPAFPVVAAAVAAGTIGTDAAAGIIRCLTQAARTAATIDLEIAERTLVAAAATESADLVLIQARVIRDTLDPDGAEPREEILRERRGISLGRERNGMSYLSGWCPPTSAALLRAAFAEGANPKAQPRFLPDEDAPSSADSAGPGYRTTPQGDLIVESLLDPRTREQRQHDILMGLVTAGLRSTENRRTSQLRPMSTVMAVIHIDNLRTGRGVGWLDDVSEPVSSATVQQLVCDAGYRKIVLGPHGEVLHLGHPERLFSAAQRKALAVRDGGCVWPGCTAPPTWCEAHHVIEHGHNGPTDIDNGTLLCSAHHHMLHASDFTMTMLHGKPHLLAPPWLDPNQIWKPLGRTRATLGHRRM